MLAPFDQTTFSGSASYVNPGNEQFLFFIDSQKK